MFAFIVLGAAFSYFGHSITAVITIEIRQLRLGFSASGSRIFCFLLYSLLRIVDKIVIMLTDTDNYLTILFIYYIFMKKKLVRDHTY